MLMAQVMPLRARSDAVEDDHLPHEVNQLFLSFSLVPRVLQELPHIAVSYAIHPGWTRRDIVIL